MKFKLLLFLSLIFSIHFNAQSYIFGKVVSDGGAEIQDVTVVNIRTDEMVLSNRDGHFMVSGKIGDELRFIKAGYDRVVKKVSQENVQQPMNISLVRSTIQIPEVQIAFKPTGNLAKDSKRLSEPQKLRSLKSEMSKYMRSPLKEPLPDKSISKTFTGHDYKVGQVDVLGVIGKAVSLISKADKPKITKANYIEYQNFMIQLKNEVNLDFLRKYGMEDEQIDTFLVYAEETRYLSRKFRKDFDKAVLRSELQVAFAEYRKLNKLDTK
ncbi:MULTISPECIES: hypothetical protein [unclassified Chryseobacterium]|uniref:hypothetical protein n=1 Tax=unclassified Chryseobacterium TaxID=2593645 RepID=UPI00100AAC30|nr:MULTISPECIES: hypothetical protein [unclassified Chryseobacterium]RXM49810.1 hypothetical protein BOQ64_21250 [Chryseobacterium sp. CH25]RXM61960.1 hypothetical protein BOQ60_22025 [Chryseobacterium sp. CH1]